VDHANTEITFFVRAVLRIGEYFSIRVQESKSRLGKIDSMLLDINLLLLGVPDEPLKADVHSHSIS